MVNYFCHKWSFLLFVFSWCVIKNIAYFSCPFYLAISRHSIFRFPFLYQSYSCICFFDHRSFYCTIRILRKNLSFSIKDIVSTWTFSHKFYALFLLHQARHILFFLIYLCPNSWSWKIKQPKFSRTLFLVFNTWPHFFFWLFKKRQSPFLLIINPRKEIFWWIYILFSISAIGFQYFHH